MDSNPQQPTGAAPSDFLRSLLDAMRRVAETTRDRTLAEMRDALEADAARLDEARSARETALRERAAAEITDIGSWERAEVERVRAEALRKVQARGGQLDKELADLATSSTTEHEALVARADAYEREVEAFIQELDAIQDPAAFAAAARRMPSPWGAQSQAPSPTASRDAAHPLVPGAPPAESAAPQPAALKSPALAAVEVQAPAEGPGRPEVDPSKVVADAAGNAPEGQRPSDASTGGASTAEAVAVEPDPDLTTSIQVHGLSSFGAITSFKQSLERVEGIRSVTLGLGPTGEFIYTATHAPAFDLDAAIRAIEGEGVHIERDNGTLRVRVGKAARTR